MFARLVRINPFLDCIPPLERDIVTTSFASRVQAGRYGNRHTIKVAGVTDALAAISKTIELAGKPSPIYRTEHKYQLYIERMVEGYRRADPPSVPQLAVPVSVPKTAYNTYLNCGDPVSKRTACLIIVAFYYLL